MRFTGQFEMQLTGQLHANMHVLALFRMVDQTGTLSAADNYFRATVFAIRSPGSFFRVCCLAFVFAVIRSSASFARKDSPSIKMDSARCMSLSTSVTAQAACTLFRNFSAKLGRWLSRDPLEEEISPNVYAYVENNAISKVDPLGLFNLHIPGTNFCGEGYSSGHYGDGYGESDPGYPQPGTGEPRTGPVSGPLNGLDTCCMNHDDCMNRAHYVKDPHDRKQCRKKCDNKLAKCAIGSGIGSGIGLGLGLVFGVKQFFRGPGTYIGN